MPPQGGAAPARDGLPSSGSKAAAAAAMCPGVRAGVCAAPAGAVSYFPFQLKRKVPKETAGFRDDRWCLSVT